MSQWSDHGFEHLVAARPGLVQTSIRIAESFRDRAGSALVPEGLQPNEVARWLYDDAPFCVLAHGTDADPLFIYANLMAQRCFEYSWDEFIGLRSRYSAEPQDREARQRLLDDVARQGLAKGYRGLRIAKSGRRFWIEDGVVWRMVDAAGAPLGQAAMFPRWRDA